MVLGKGGVDISEYFCVHYIGRRNERWLAIDRRVCDHNSDVFGVPHPGESDVELAVGEDRRGQVEGNFLKGLALGLVDGHGEGGADRDLSATDLYRYVLVLWVGVHIDTGNADDVADVTAGKDLGLDDGAG